VDRRKEDVAVQLPKLLALRRLPGRGGPPGTVVGFGGDSRLRSFAKALSWRLAAW